MGGILSVCGLGNDADHDPQLHYQSKDFTQNFSKTTERGRSFSTATDSSSVASILSSSEQLIPDIYMAKDIQVLSQRRQRHPRYSGKSAPLSSSKVSNSSRARGTVKIVRNTDAAESLVGKKYTFGIKTASSSFGYSDDDDPSAHHQPPPTAMNARTNGDIQRRLSGPDLVKSSA
ncbi:hypothetical protein PHYBOEH_009801 [Phytophthora boehmeriae]|uniref:Uncharacterized protein n=1 Tax=Phytophthora boehmeriae TaxID=109152 RepID=A0A8T1VQW8_9STRA|nr:hypothetical protein PHYBOEH_009801 [Phytophthora boehmeriae]